MSDSFPQGASSSTGRLNAAANVYALSVIVAGTAAIATAGYRAWAAPIDPEWLLLAMLTVASGALRLRLSSVPMSFSVSETFTFATLLLFGPAAATLTVALDGLAISLRLSRPGPVRLFFNTASPALAMWIAGQVFTALIGDGLFPQSGGLDPWFFPALAIVTAIYFLLQTGLVAVAVAITTRRQAPDVWRANFARLWPTFFGGAYFAALMAFSVQQLGPSYLILVLPLPLLLHFIFSMAVGSVDDHEDARRASEAMFGTLAETMTAAVFVIQDGRLRYVNGAAESITGRTRTSLTSGDWADIAHPDSRALVRGHVDAVARGGAADRCDVRLQTSGQGERWVEMSWASIPFAARPAVLAVAFDVTERTEARRALERVASVYRSLVQGAVFGIYRCTLDGHFIDVNPALVAMLGYESAAALIEASAAGNVYVSDEERLRLQHAYAQTGRIDNVEVQWKRRDGSVVVARLSGRAVTSDTDDDAGFEVIAEDVTERRELEEQLRQAQKMEAIGRLAGGIAHDFNNLLTAIVGYSDLLTVQLRGSPLSTEVDEIRGAALRAGALTQQLLAFGRKQVLTPTVLDLSMRVEDMRNMLGRLLGADIDLRITAGQDLWRVRGDAGQIDQVLLNLSVNARDAMPTGGRLTITAHNTEVDALDARRLAPLAPGRWVVLTVADTGTGIDADTMRHIFEPFFTTKEYGKGTGLGLATVYGIVKQSGGHVRVESQPGMGTTFSVYLPAVDAPADPQPSRAPEIARATGDGTVLVVEDEPSVRRLAVQVLANSGYRVLEAANGAAALQVSRQHEGPIHLLVTDVVMPGLRGPGLAAALLRERPDLKIVFMSGYTDPEQVSDAMRFAGSTFMQKPFTPTALAKAVHDFLDAPDPALAPSGD